jgi:DNA modification methylase
MRDPTNKSKEAPNEGPPKPALLRPPRAELVWEGKHDAAGRRVAPLRVALPFQTVETINESAQDRQKGFQFGSSFREEAWRNRLIWGDKKYVLPSLLPEFAGQVNLIYIDPPFDTGADFSFTATVPDDPASEEDGSFTFTKEPSIIEHKAYRDTWGHGLESYLQWLYETASFLHELLHETGSMYVHLDTGVGHYAKVILDEVFGQSNFRSDIIWKRTGSHNSARRFGPVHDTILYFTKTDAARWNQQRQSYDEQYKKKFEKIDTVTGEKFQDVTLTGPGTRTGPSGQPWRGFDPTSIGRHWQPASYLYTKYQQLTGRELSEFPLIERLDELDKVGLIYWPKGGQPRYKQFLSDAPGLLTQDVWTDIDAINSQAQERLGYPTQKPIALLNRIIATSSNEGDLVFDPFCGSGTTAAAAESLGRRWIACDLSRFAIHTTRKRLLSTLNVRPFLVQNLGKYERQIWAGAEFGEGSNQAAERQRAYIDFILKLDNATPINGYTWLHGVKGGRMVHVGAVDAPVSGGDVTHIAAEFKRAVGTGKDAPKTNGVDVLGWDFAFELNEIAKQQAAAANIQMRFLRIPRDVMDKRAV